MSDAEALRRAAVVLRQRSKRPRSLLLAVICGVLNDTAAKIEAEQAAMRPPGGP